MEELKNTVNENKTKGKYCYIQTDKTIDEIKEIFKKRKINEITLKNDIVLLKFDNAISKSALNKLFENNIIFTSYIKKNSNIKTTEDTWFIRHIKKVFESYDIDYDDLEKFETTDEFFNKYNPVALEKKVIALINEIYIQKYRNNKKQEVLKYIEQGGLRPFQKTVYNIIKGKSNNRLIYCISESKGNVGKSATFNDYISYITPTLLVDGKKGDAFYALKGLIDTGRTPSVIVYDAPRSKTREKNGNEQLIIPYDTLENIKNRKFLSTKYESGECELNKSPFVFILSNEPIDESQLSHDRIRYIDVKTGKITDINNNIRDENDKIVKKYDDYLTQKSDTNEQEIIYDGYKLHGETYYYKNSKDDTQDDIDELVEELIEPLD